MFYVSRQAYWGLQIDEGCWTVEVAGGGSDYSNPGELMGAYRGEQTEYADPREAVKVAFQILEEWRVDSPVSGQWFGVGCGYTGGSTMPFEHMTREEADAWAESEWESLPKCDRCGDVYEKRDEITLWEYEGSYCSDTCANRAVEVLECERLLMDMLDAEVEDDDEIYTTGDEFSVMYVNPDDETQQGLIYCGTASEVRWRFKSWGIEV